MSSLLETGRLPALSIQKCKSGQADKSCPLLQLFLRPFRHIIHYFQCHNIIGRRQLIVAAFNVIMAN